MKKDIDYYINKSNIFVKIPLTSQGKFRCKIRKNIEDFGVGFAPKTNIISNNSYLEWQIGYDTLVGKKCKETKLNNENFLFIGANKKQKYPYELSEITFYMCKEKIIQKNEIDLLIQKIKDTKEFLKEKFSIKKQKEKNVQLNNFIFSSSSTNLPTFYFKTSNNLIIEIMIEKQQYATGIQPMLYLDIPISSFINSNEIIGNTSAHIKYGILNFNKELKDLILNLFICFGMCSKSHNYDVLEILNIIKTNAF